MFRARTPITEVKFDSKSGAEENEENMIENQMIENQGYSHLKSITQIWDVNKILILKGQPLQGD